MLEAIEALKECFTRYYKLKKNAVALRESWLLDLVAIKALHSEGNQESIYYNFITQER
jgi:hypothetical protein